MADTETANALPETIEEAKQEAKSFLAQAQEAIGDAVDATVAAVKEHPIAAAGIAAGVAAAVGGAAYAATQLGGDKEPAPAKAKEQEKFPSPMGRAGPGPGLVPAHGLASVIFALQPSKMTQASDIVADLERLYNASVDRLKAALNRYINDGTPPNPEDRTDGSFAYPELRLVYRGGEERGRPAPRRSFGRLVEEGEYRISVTRPAMFSRYLTEQLTLLIEDYDVEVHAVTGRQEIPFPYVLDPGHIANMDQISVTELGRHFPATELAHIGDEIADGLWLSTDDTRPLALFDALRTDFSLARLRHYTGTPVEHFQQYILFTNYHRYVDEFVRWAVDQLGEGSRFTGVSGAGGILVEAGDDTDRLLNDTSAWRRHQMPAYHLMAADGSGITLVNIGVGPSNAKTITDHLAVLRPEAWLMIGHCGGLRPSQRIGDYVLAHAYLRDDHIMDDVLPPEIPIPAIAEVQLALARAAETVSGQSGEELKQRLRTGTIVTTDDRNWELRYSKSALRFSLSRAVGIDMESATLAAQGYRFRVPYGTLLCVSDKPLHGELKLPGQANRFYERAIAEHLKIGIETCEELRREGPRLHSRKLRAFNEPPFR